MVTLPYLSLNELHKPPGYFLAVSPGE